jgi:hypothetical protein
MLVTGIPPMDIIINEFNRIDLAIDWMAQQNQTSVIIPLNSLFINGMPNILPLDYFFPLSVKKKFPLYHSLLLALKNHAPPALSPKSLRKIAEDIHPIHQLFWSKMDHSYEWLYGAMQDYKKSPCVVDYVNEIKTKIRTTAQWISMHYDQIIIYGHNHHQTDNLYRMLQLISMPIHWVLPSLTTKRSHCSFSELPEWISQWAIHPDSTTININAFETIEDECKQAIEIANTMDRDVALVTPNDRIRDQIYIEGIKQGVAISKGDIRLKNTPLGHLLTALLHWLRQPNIPHLNQIVYAWPWQHTEPLKTSLKKVLSIGWTSPKKPTLAALMSALDENHPIRTIAKIKSLNDIYAFIHTMAMPYCIDSWEYFNFNCKTTGLAFLKDAIDMSASVDDTLVLMDYINVDIPPITNPRMVCISPEDIGKFPGHAIWVLGFGSDSWTCNSGTPYLMADASLLFLETDKTIRNAFGGWCIFHPQLLGVSFSKSMENTVNRPLELCSVVVHNIQAANENTCNFTRTPPRYLNANALNEISLSDLSFYQRCPHAFYLKKVMGISSKSPQSYYQVFGILIHQVIALLATSQLKKETELNTLLRHNFSPLMAATMAYKIQTEWPLHELEAFFKGIVGTIETEKELTLNLNGMMIKGRADIIVNNDAGIEIIDVKSGALPTLSAIRNHDYIQLGAYMLMVEATQNTEHLSASLIGKESKYKSMIDCSSSTYAAYKQGLMGHLTGLINGVKTGEFSTHFSRGSEQEMAKLCRVCDYYHACYYRNRHQR